MTIRKRNNGQRLRRGGVAPYASLLSEIGSVLAEGRQQAFSAVNNVLLATYWRIGERIVAYEQRGRLRAAYGSQLLAELARDLSLRHGKGFSRSNVYLMRQLYLLYPKIQTLSGKLGWSHYAELVGIDDGLERSFYEQQSIRERWSVRELQRQMSSALYQRLALSTDKRGVLELARKGHVVTEAEEFVKEPYILEFLGIPDHRRYSEKELEQRIIDNLQLFLLELGKGLTFVARQFRLTLGNNHYYIDLVFYHRILRCFVLIDLKLGNASHADVGQMNLYLNYFKAEESSGDDAPPIGIILAARKNNVEVAYALGGISNKLFVSRYKLYLPDKRELMQQLRSLLGKR